ncbi:MAG: CoA transferase subunit A [Thaumarchaeota archaeon]|nr:CoA transferase subunit A [Candidatus Calditenuaceae archaeon]MDW8187161.1 CoA-transferase [Nitrososphaerota archaeon]
MKLVKMEEALELVEDGSTVTISGISFSRNPMAFIFALERRGVRDLGFVDREPGVGLEYMIKKGMVKRVRAAMVSLEWFGIPMNFRRAIERGEITFLEDTCGAFMAGIRAGSIGVPFMPVRGVLGSDLIKLHEESGSWKVIRDPFDGDEVVLVKAIVPDLAIIHCHRADPLGNAEIEGPVYEDEFKAKAAKTVIVTAEEIVDEDYFKGKRPTIHSTYVKAVVHAPGGAKPTGMFRLYDVDYDAIWDLLSS